MSKFNIFFAVLLLVLAVTNFGFFIFGAHLIINLIAGISCLLSMTLLVYVNSL